MIKYDDFLKAKAIADVPTGFDCEPACDQLFDFQRAIVKWAIKRGRAAILADTGLGKTPMQVIWAAEVAAHTGHPVWILAPLSVSNQTVKEAIKFGVEVTYCRSDDVVVDGPHVYITNYEMLGAFDPSLFSGIVLDESSILKAYDGKTRSAIIAAAQGIPYRLSCTATPSPNDHMELGNQAEFLGVMSRNEMLSMFFVHDGGSTSQWRLKGHGVAKFWKWVANWAVVIRSPDDIGFDGSRYELPPLNIHEHILDSGSIGGDLFGGAALSLADQRAAKRASMADRVAECAKLVNASDEVWLVWCHMNDESDALKKAIPDAKAIAGYDTIKYKEATMDAFSDGDLNVLITKPSIAGYGMNWQHCSHMAFVGMDHSFEMYYQAIRRSWRFGQTHQVDVHLFIGASEAEILNNLRRKERQHNEMSEQMIGHMRNLMKKQIFGATMEKASYETAVAKGDRWMMYLGDCVEIVAQMESSSIDYTIFSPPFASLYTYSNSDRDMGNSVNDHEFMTHFGFLVEELLRVTIPGRLCSFHCFNIPAMKARDGYIGLKDFRGDLIRMFVDAGWIYHSEVCIWKDPVTAMQRTKALGLLHKQIKKDSAMSRQGIPDYLVTMRKPGANPKPITHTDKSFPVQIWQRYASPVWMDINPTRTLQYREARENDDERHICPLQLDVIERAIELWTNPGDLVLSPFGGIGSEPFTAIEMGRRAVAIELKRSYWDLAVRNLSCAGKQIDLFATL